MAKKLKVRIPDKKEDVLVETTQKSLSWARRFQGPLVIVISLMVCATILYVFGVELEKKGDQVAWEEYLAVGEEGTPEAYAEIAEKYKGSSVEPWALLDQARVLTDRDEAIRIYKEVADRFPDNDLIQKLASEGREGLLREIQFQVPQEETP
jgi:hypothetical protein